MVQNGLLLLGRKKNQPESKESMQILANIPLANKTETTAKWQRKGTGSQKSLGHIKSLCSPFSQKGCWATHKTSVAIFCKEKNSGQSITTPGDTCRWGVLSELENQWDKVALQIAWKLETCTKPRGESPTGPESLPPHNLFSKKLHSTPTLNPYGQTKGTSL